MKTFKKIIVAIVIFFPFIFLVAIPDGLDWLFNHLSDFFEDVSEYHFKWIKKLSHKILGINQ